MSYAYTIKPKIFKLCVTLMNQCEDPLTEGTNVVNGFSAQRLLSCACNFKCLIPEHASSLLYFFRN